MIYSNYTGKTYKSLASYKAVMTKQRKAIERDLADVNKCISEGWTLYLGFPIKRFKNAYIKELALIDNDVAQNV